MCIGEKTHDNSAIVRQENLVGEEGGVVEHKAFEGSESLPYDTLMMDPCHCTFIHTHRLSDTKKEP